MTPPGKGGSQLRTIVSHAVAVHAKTFFKLHPTLQATVESTAAFAVDLALLLSGTDENCQPDFIPAETYGCDLCQREWHVQACDELKDTFCPYGCVHEDLDGVEHRNDLQNVGSPEKRQQFICHKGHRFGATVDEYRGDTSALTCILCDELVIKVEKD